LDEPTSVLAPSEATELLEWLRRFASSGGTAIIITHKLREARAYADDLTVLRRGRTVLTGPAKSITDESLAAAMLGASPLSERAVRGTSGRQHATVVQADSISIRGSRGNIAIRDATFQIAGGEIVGVAGVEASGHHELLLALSGRAPVSSGSLSIPSRIGFVPEDRHRDGVVLAFTLAQNLAIRDAGPRRGRLRWQRFENRMTTLLQLFDIRARGYDDAMADLSGGNQQKAVLARELEDDPTLIVLENPTRGLDIRAAAFVRAQLGARRDAGAAVVLYSSDLDEVVDGVDRVLVVHDGRVRSMEPDRALVGAAMLGIG
jgi:ABC-type uncharacterized transport system ATPase subunit